MRKGVGFGGAGLGQALVGEPDDAQACEGEAVDQVAGGGGGHETFGWAGDLAAGGS